MSTILALLILVLALGACGGGDDDPSPGRDRALIAAPRAGDADRVRSLLEEGADVHARDATGATALAAAYGNHLDAARALIEAGADVNAKDETQQSAIVKRLLETEIEIDHVNRLGWTALLEAIILGGGDRRHTQVVRLLVDAGADINLADAEGVTALAHARRRGFDTIAGILEGSGGRT